MSGRQLPLVPIREALPIPESHSHNLDVLRALAVCFVVLSHLLIEHSLGTLGGAHVQSLGTLGVMIFFVHTCLVLMQSLERLRHTDARPNLALRFLVMRAFRIYPMSIVVVLALGSLDWLLPGSSLSFSTLLSNLFLVQNLTGAPSVTPVLWSLPYEVQMYLLLPGLFGLTLLTGRYAWRWIVACWCGGVILFLLFWKLDWNHDLVRFLPCFLPGVLAYCLRERSRKYPAACLFLFVGAGAVAFPLLVGAGLSATLLSWVFCLALGSLIPHCRDVTSPALHQCGETLARYSYGIYLVHVPVLYLCFHILDLPALIAWPMFIAGVSLLSWLAYHYIEKPGIAYGRRLAARIGAPWSPAARSA
ncbi:MAG: acyltransferase [Oxalobacteraceae bacterium]|nr:MAG: acyltransferase [Oxalobacteraceae bacterium]